MKSASKAENTMQSCVQMVKETVWPAEGVVESWKLEQERREMGSRLSYGRDSLNSFAIGVAAPDPVEAAEYSRGHRRKESGCSQAGFLNEISFLVIVFRKIACVLSEMLSFSNIKIKI